ncbi:MAG: hypothetical protein AABX29_04205 [Nanoarchaeota archaeon]
MTKDHVHVFDMSERLHIDATFDALEDINQIRELSYSPVGNPDVFLQDYINRNFNSSRNQLNSEGLMRDILKTSEMKQLRRDGKIIIVDEDLYGEGLNWCFGGFMGTMIGLGFILLSTARLQDDCHARDLIRHEVGHMFSAPSEKRRQKTNGNVYDNLGLHCGNDLCVMQQKDTVDSSVEYSHQRARSNADSYCGQCIKDIRDYEVRE